jgi:hypothetical protein
LRAHSPQEIFELNKNLEAAPMPLRIAPSTYGLTQKSPHIANFVSLSQRHFSSGLIATAGNALPLEKEKKKNKKKYENFMEGSGNFCT